ncbi:MAG: FAD-dependent oxidoreductase, partial [Porticoccaceae bacterium]
MSRKYDFDLFVIGAGSGGVRAARMAASKGKKVAIAEVSDLGGTCVNVGCVPKKLYAHAAHYREWFDAAQGFGWSTQPGEHNWIALKRGTDAYISRLNGIYANLLSNSGAVLYRGMAEFVNSNEVVVDNERLIGTNILIATGSKAVKPNLSGVELAGDSNTFFEWTEKPNTVVVVGGGYI